MSWFTRPASRPANTAAGRYDWAERAPAAGPVLPPRPTYRPQPTPTLVVLRRLTEAAEAVVTTTPTSHQHDADLLRELADAAAQAREALTGGVR